MQCDGQSLRRPERFDLIYMTGHAFQALLTDDDVLALLTAAARHLRPGGRLIFETRNPQRRAWLSWTPEKSRTIVQTPEQGRVEEYFDTSRISAAGVVDIAHYYRFLDDGRELMGRSRIRFIAQAHVADLIVRAGLRSLAWYGDWDRQAFAPASKEIIAVAGLS